MWCRAEARTGLRPSWIVGGSGDVLSGETRLHHATERRLASYWCERLTSITTSARTICPEGLTPLYVSIDSPLPRSDNIVNNVDDTSYEPLHFRQILSVTTPIRISLLAVYPGNKHSLNSPLRSVEVSRQAAVSRHQLPQLPFRIFGARR